MKYFFSRQRLWLIAAVCLIVGVAVFSGSKQAKADPDFGDIIITVEDELGNPVTGATFTFNCDGTDYSVADGAIDDADNADDGTIHILAARVSGGTSGCENFDEFTKDSVERDGYVTEDTTLVHYFALPTESWNTATTTLDFGHKAIIVDELGNPLTVDSATAGEGAAAECVVEEDELYCAIPLAADLEGYGFSLYADGYVQKPGDETPVEAVRIAHTDPQVVTTMEVENGMDFAYKLTSITSEALGVDVAATATSVSVGDASGLNACTLSAGDWYCPVVLANSNGDLVARVIHDGYVDASTYQLVTGTTRTSEWEFQVSDTVTTVRYALKATVTANGSSFSGATVRAGDEFATSCTQDGTSGTYYCPVPLADAAGVAQAVALGYKADTADFTDRTAATDAQRTVSLSLIAVTASGGGGGSSTKDSTPESQPAPLPVPVPEPLPASIIDIIESEAAMLAARNDALAYFRTTGTESTIKLGSGERSGVLASYTEAYGHDPKTVADWTDALSIANGRWPLTVNKAVEARAYVNFRAVYGRDADMKNSGDVNALKMMGYGVLSTTPRNLSMERSAIARFVAVFGFNPSIARHWNIIRAIAYSGLIL